ncbi:SDR family oxidoreductase [Devosia ginsengisoli]|uniref:SDR family oxidoreductase n=1 Tax=Devosia ginsengisoli TaxID=400770 RepID=UPI0026ED47D3|nr:SDR family oxidoreductase [Devosia ginsengisoli]MCR6670745.1 SDR family oxidoreductase [Devosia ginsengisoli]
MKNAKGAVLILGASRGLGEAIAFAVGQAGFAVGVGCRKSEDAEAVSARLQQAGAAALPLMVDVTDAAGVTRAVEAMAGWHGKVAGLVNNAGIIDPIARLSDTDAKAWGRLIEINVIGAYHGVRAVLPYLSAGGVVVNVSSGAASHAMEGWSAYCTSKAALAMLTQSIHHEYGAQNILAFGFRPGVVDTGMQSKIRDSGLNPVSQLPRETLLKPEVPAKAVAWLFDSAPADLAGQELDVRDAALKLRMG